MPGKITDLTPIGDSVGGVPNNFDLIEVIDVSDTSLAPTGTNKKLNLGDLWTWLEIPTGGTPTGTKLTDLTALTGANAAATDVLEVVDISDTTMDASGTNKKMTLTEVINFIKLAGGAISDGDKTDITVSGGTWTIDAGVVTNAKLADMSPNTIKGRSGPTGAPLDLTAAQVKTILAITGADISNASVTNTQLATMATLTIKGNNTAGTTNPSDLTAAQVRSMTASGAGAFFGFDFDTTTTAGPAATRIRLNNATPASATIVYVSYTTKDGVELKTRLLAGTAGDRLFMQDRANSANYRVYELTGTPTDGTTYASCAVVHRGGGGTITNLMEIVAGYAAAPFTVGPTAPSSPLTNDLWVDTT